MATWIRAHGFPPGRHALGHAEPPPPARRRRSITVRVLDGRGRATRAGAEVRVFAAVPERWWVRDSSIPIRLRRAERPPGARRFAQLVARRRRGDAPGGGQAGRRARRERGPADGKRPGDHGPRRRFVERQCQRLRRPSQLLAPGWRRTSIHAARDLAHPQRAHRLRRSPESRALPAHGLG